MYSMLYEITSIDICFLVIILFLLLYIFLNKPNEFKYKKFSFKKISNILQQDIDLLFELYYKEKILSEILRSNTLLGTNEIHKYVKEIFLFFQSIYPKNEYKSYNKLLNNNLESVIINLIYIKIKNFNISMKLKVDEKSKEKIVY